MNPYNIKDANIEDIDAELKRREGIAECLIRISTDELIKIRKELRNE